MKKILKEKFNVNHIPALKQEILDLPEKEKNQLLIRLINKDQVLIEQLHFRLLEDEYDLIKRYEDLKAEIVEVIESFSLTIQRISPHSRANIYLRMIRNLSGRINHFAKVTKDSNYELQLRTILFLETTKKYSTIQGEDSVAGYKARQYQITRIKAMLKLFDKLHADLKYDYSTLYYDEIETVLKSDLKHDINLSGIDYSVLNVQ